MGATSGRPRNPGNGSGREGEWDSEHLDRRELLVARRRAADVDALRRRRSCAQELATLAAHGCNVTRSFCFWPDFVPEPETARRGRCSAASPTSSTRTSRPVSARSRRSSSATCPARTGIRPGASGRDLYRDVWLVAQQAWFAAEIAAASARTRRSSAGSSRTRCRSTAARRTSDEIAAWARILVQAVRAAGATQPISLGDGAWGIEVTGDDNGYSLRDARAARRLRRPARLPDGGRPGAPARSPPPSPASSPAASAGRSCSRSSASPRTSPPTSTPPTTTGRSCTRRCSPAPAAGSPGTTATSTTSRDQDPYRHHAFEMHFGLTDRARPAEAAAARRSRGSRRSSRELAARRLGAASPATWRSSCPSTSSASCRSRPRPTGATSATTSSRPTSPRARPTCRSRSSASATASPRAPASTSRRARSS